MGLAEICIRSMLKREMSLLQIAVLKLSGIRIYPMLKEH